MVHPSELGLDLDTADRETERERDRWSWDKEICIEKTNNASTIVL